MQTQLQQAIDQLNEAARASMTGQSFRHDPEETRFTKILKHTIGACPEKVLKFETKTKAQNFINNMRKAMEDGISAQKDAENLAKKEAIDSINDTIRNFDESIESLELAFHQAAAAGVITYNQYDDLVRDRLKKLKSAYWDSEGMTLHDLQAEINATNQTTTEI